MRSSRRRGPSAMATVRSGGRAEAEGGLAGSTTATATPSPSACLTAAANASPDAAPPAMTRSNTGRDSVTGGTPRTRVQFRMFERSAQSRTGGCASRAPGRRDAAPPNCVAFAAQALLFLGIPPLRSGGGGPCEAWWRGPSADESAAENHKCGEDAAPNTFSPRSDVVELAQVEVAGQTDVSPTAPDRPLHLGFLLRQGQARGRDRRDGSRRRGPTGARRAAGRVAAGAGRHGCSYSGARCSEESRRHCGRDPSAGAGDRRGRSPLHRPSAGPPPPLRGGGIGAISPRLPRRFAV